MVQHVDVHRRRNHNGRGRRQIKSGKEIVGDTLRELSQNVSGRGRDHKRVNCLRNRDVLNGRFHVGLGLVGTEKVGDHLFAGECGET